MTNLMTVPPSETMLKVKENIVSFRKRLLSFEDDFFCNSESKSLMWWCDFLDLSELRLQQFQIFLIGLVVLLSFVVSTKAEPYKQGIL